MKDLNKRLARANLVEERLDPKWLYVAGAREVWAEHRTRNKYGAVAPLLTPPSANMKLGKGERSYGLSLAPDKSSENWSVCPHSTAVCRTNCIAYSGNGMYPKVQRARMLKTDFLGQHPQEFVTLLSYEISNPLVEAVRLNVFSDIKWEEHVPWLFEAHPEVDFYDYTKHPLRDTPPNYHITYSVSERTGFDQVLVHYGAGRNVAVVFDTPRTKPLPEFWNGLPVIDGDKTDARYNDPSPVVVGLRAKGTMRKHGGRMVQHV